MSTESTTFRGFTTLSYSQVPVRVDKVFGIPCNLKLLASPNLRPTAKFLYDIGFQLVKEQYVKEEPDIEVIDITEPSKKRRRVICDDINSNAQKDSSQEWKYDKEHFCVPKKRSKITCDETDVKSVSQSLLKDLLERLQWEKNLPYRCPTCKFATQSLLVLQSHLEQGHTKPSLPFQKMQPITCAFEHKPKFVAKKFSQYYHHMLSCHDMKVSMRSVALGCLPLSMDCPRCLFSTIMQNEYLSHALICEMQNTSQLLKPDIFDQTWIFFLDGVNRITMLGTLVRLSNESSDTKSSRKENQSQPSRQTTNVSRSGSVVATSTLQLMSAGNKAKHSLIRDAERVLNSDRAQVNKPHLLNQKPIQPNQLSSGVGPVPSASGQRQLRPNLPSIRPSQQKHGMQSLRAGPQSLSSILQVKARSASDSALFRALRQRKLEHRVRAENSRPVLAEETAVVEKVGVVDPPATVENSEVINLSGNANESDPPSPVIVIPDTEDNENNVAVNSSTTDENEKPQICELCNGYLYPSDADKHLKSQHGIHIPQNRSRVHSPEKSCKECGKNFISSQGLFNHVKYPGCEIGMRCPFCSESHLKEVIYSHISICHDEHFKSMFDKGYCLLCDNDDDHPLDLEHHWLEAHNMKLVLLENENENVISLFIPSGSWFSKDGKLEGEGEIFSCPECDMTFSDRIELRNHFINSGHRLRCSMDDCSAEFVDRFTLMSHLTVAHAHEKRVCRWCPDFTCDTAVALNKHLREFHCVKLPTIKISPVTHEV